MLAFSCICAAVGAAEFRSCGLTMNQVRPRIVAVETRRHAPGFFALSAFLISCALFLLIVLELHTLQREQEEHLKGVKRSKGVSSVASWSHTG